MSHGAIAYQTDIPINGSHVAEVYWL